MLDCAGCGKGGKEMDPFEYGSAFLETRGNPSAAKALFAEWLTELQQRPFWSLSSLDGRRIPWRLAEDANDHFAKAELSQPGCYAFGAAPALLRYIGSTGCTGAATRMLSDRVFGRYLLKRGRRGARPSSKDQPSVSCQCFLAEDYEAAIVSSALRLLSGKGRDHADRSFLADLFPSDGYEAAVHRIAQGAFPEDLLETYKRNHRNIYRFAGAVDFVLHELDGIWFTLLPLGERSQIASLEKHLIWLADEWNLAHGCKVLFQVDHKYRVRSHLDGARPR